MILLIDNYDSFTYNLYQYICEFEDDVCVIRNDQLCMADIEILKPAAILLSPGPGRPDQAGCMEDIIRHYHTTIPMLGICLGHQAIAEVFGATIQSAKTMKHGEVDTITICRKSRLFENMPDTFEAARYHSLAAVDPGNELYVTAISDDQEIMAIEHRDYPLYGVQFHPESIMTPQGKTIIHNFLKGATPSC